MQTVLRVGNMTAREWLLCLLDQPVCNALKTNLGSDRRETVPELKTIGGTSLEGALRNHVAQLCFKKGQIYLRLFLIYVSHLFSICSEEYFNILNGRIHLLSISPPSPMVPVKYCYSLLNQASVQNCFCSLLPNWRWEGRCGGRLEFADHF